MKHFYYSLLACCVFFGVNSQNIVFPDTNLKTWLLELDEVEHLSNEVWSYGPIDVNADGEISISEAQTVAKLELIYNETSGIPKITNLSGIEHFSNLTQFHLTHHDLSTFDASVFPMVELLWIGNNPNLTSINVQGLQHLETLSLNNNSLTELDASNLSLNHLVISNNHIPQSALNVSGNPFLTSLFYDNNDLTTLDLSAFASLYELSCDGNQLTALDCSGISLGSLSCDANLLTSLDLSGQVNLHSLSCANNQISTLNLTGCRNLYSVICSNNLLTSYEVSFTGGYEGDDYAYLDCSNNLLTHISLKDGHGSWTLVCNGNDALAYVCTDESEIESTLDQLAQSGFDPESVVVNSYCSFVPGGTFYEISGTQSYDVGSDGCDPSDIAFPNLKIDVVGQNQTQLIPNASGDYFIPLQSGDYVLSPVLENPTYFAVSPANLAVSFPNQTSPLTQNFCVAPNGSHPDVEISLFPFEPARPGFDASYKLVYKNKGTQVESGSVNFTFDAAAGLEFVSASVTPTSNASGLLSFNFTGLQLFESREITIVLNANSPVETPAINVDDELNFTAGISTPSVDETPSDNLATLKQIVVGSYDPNDKTCSSGPVAGPEVIGEYVDYVIRFENTGNYPAEFVVVKDLIDETQFDVSSLVPISASHNFYTRIEGNKVEFIFENIQLPFDDANNDGYVAFKIKTLPTLAVGDTFSNFASIYFDYNAPVITDPASTIIEELSVSEVDFASNFRLYPNPAENVLRIHSNGLEVKSVEIYNLLGQLVVTSIGSQDIDVSGLKSGNYLVRVHSQTGASVGRFVKR